MAFVFCGDIKGGSGWDFVDSILNAHALDNDFHQYLSGLLVGHDPLCDESSR
jgi:hypothetical protein